MLRALLGDPGGTLSFWAEISQVTTYTHGHARTPGAPLRFSPYLMSLDQ